MSFDVLYEEDSSSPPSALDRRNVILSVDSHLGVLFARYKFVIGGRLRRAEHDGWRPCFADIR